MPVLDPKILSELAARATELAAEVHTNVLMKRSVDHRVLETMAVVATCIFGVGGYMYWAIKVQSK